MRILVLFTLISLIFTVGCKKDEENDDSTTFDRGELLKNYAENIILPNYSDLNDNTLALKLAIETFLNDVSETNLILVQEKWIETAKSWQHCNAFNFGPAGAEGLNKGLNEEIATFPVSADKIETALASPNFNDFNRDARGLYAIEYLLFDLEEDNQTILTAFQNEDRKSYLQGAVDALLAKVEGVLSSWSGSYKNNFITNNGSDAGSSVSDLYNEFVKSFESIKNLKIELPLGKRPGQTVEEPQLVEAYYSGISLELLEEHLIAIENTWYGKTKAGTKGIGFIDYLNSVEGGEELVSATIAQWTNVKTAFNAISKSERLSDQVVNSPEPIDAFREELQKHTRFFKSDMSSRLGIAITYSSGDGD